jgi:two-component system sensor histidine kinase KdpD
MPLDDRPDPDELLARVNAEEAREKRGKLRIYFGYAAGVGKTYGMLNAAQRERALGVDIVVGYVEPHGRVDTEALLAGLETVPPKTIPYRGVALREFDLDAALARRPRIILVDELAHTNVEGSRHAKRWQDVEELLQAGINVWTTLNVQHVESLNDVIAQITGVVVRETLPDAVLEKADEIELIDITPEELLERLQEGKVYIPEQAQRALENFFQRQNLTALRELSLRQAADRLRRDVDAAREALRRTQPWATSERLLVCVGPSPTTARLIRTAKRMAAAFGAEWMAAAVESPGRAASPEAKASIVHHLRLAEQLGATTHILSGTRVAESILELARARNVTKIVIGKTAQPRWKRLLGGTVVDELLEKSGAIDVYVIQGEREGGAPRTPPAPRSIGQRRYFAAACVVAISTVIAAGASFADLAETNVVMVFLLGVTWTAYRYGRGPGIVAAIASVLVFDFGFVPPFYTFAVSDAQYVVTFFVMLVIGVTISTLTVRLREQLVVSKQQEHRTASLFQLTRQLSAVQGTDFLAMIAGQRLAEIFEGEAVVYTLRNGQLSLRHGEKSSIAANPQNELVARWVAEHEQMAGLGTDTLPSATALFLPMIGSQQTVGAVGVRSADEARMLDPEQRHLLATCASLIALSIERDWSVVEAHESRLKAETEKLRSTLLSSVSHDLRTPLAVIAGASSSLLKSEGSMSVDTRRELLATIVEESQRLSRLVENLLNMTRLESGVQQVHKEWHVVEDVVGSAIREVSRQIGDRTIETQVPSALPLVPLDAVLVEQVLINLLENAAKYSSPGTPITISARAEAKSLIMEVGDRGPGLQPGDERRIFEKFFRSATTRPQPRGAGLGLAICRAIVEAHEGRIWAQNRTDGPGAVFRFSLPIVGQPPEVSLVEHSQDSVGKG